MHFILILLEYQDEIAKTSILTDILVLLLYLYGLPSWVLSLCFKELSYFLLVHIHENFLQQENKQFIQECEPWSYSKLHLLINLTCTYLLNRCYVSGTFLSTGNPAVSYPGSKPVNRFLKI